MNSFKTVTVYRLVLCLFLVLNFKAIGICGEFSFSDCNEILSEAELTKIMGLKSQYGTQDTASGTFKNSSRPKELGKQLKMSTDAKHGCAQCEFSGPLRGGEGVYATEPIFTGLISTCITNVRPRFKAFTNNNAATLKSFKQEVVEESSEIGKATVINKMKIGTVLQSTSVKFLDDDTEAYVDVSLNISGEEKVPSHASNGMPNDAYLLKKSKAIAKEVEKTIK